MIFFLYGADAYSSKQKVFQLKEKFIREVDPDGESLVVLDGETASLDKISMSVGANSLFARRRMVVVENIFNSKKDFFAPFLKYLENFEKANKSNEDGNILIFWQEGEAGKIFGSKKKLADFLKKRKFSQEFKQKSNTELNQWTRQEFSSLGGRISLQLATEINSILGGDMWRISSEIKKLASYKGVSEKGGFEIKREDVQEMVRGNFDENIFALTDAIGLKNKALAIKILEGQLEAGITIDYLVSMIIWQFKKLFQVRVALDLGQSQRTIASSLKMHPFVAQKSIAQVRNFDAKRIKDVLNKLVDIYKLSREDKVDARTSLGLVLASF